LASPCQRSAVLLSSSSPTFIYMEKSGPELSRKSDSLRSGWLARDRDRSRRPFTTYGVKSVGTEARRKKHTSPSFYILRHLERVSRVMGSNERATTEALKLAQPKPHGISSAPTISTWTTYMRMMCCMCMHSFPTHHSAWS
jgi:hypothetical protein